MGARRTAAAAVIAGLSVMAVAPGLFSAAAAGTKTFGDPVGDAGTGFDVTGVTVANDNAGKLTFAVSLPAVATPPANMWVFIGLDTDLKPTPGGQGLDYTIVVAKGGVLLFKPTASGPGSPLIPPSLSTSFQQGVMTVAINLRDIGAPRFFGLSVASFTELPDGSLDTVNNVNSAPDTGMVLHEVKLPTKLLVRSSSLSPARPSAGAEFRAGMSVRDVTFGSPGEPAAGGAVKCTFTIGGRPVTTRGSLTRAGRATCRGRAPADSAGKGLTGTIRYRQGTATISRTFAGRVR